MMLEYDGGCDGARVWRKRENMIAEKRRAKKKRLIKRNRGS
jgi:hypothetical protein